MTVVILALILHMLTWKLPGIHAPRILDWSSGRDTRVLQIFFKTLPADDEQEARMENLWSVKSSGSRDFAYRELQQRAHKLIEDHYKKWQGGPIAERQKLMDDFSHVFHTIREPRIEDSKRIADIVIGQNKAYSKEANMIRSVVLKLLEQRVPHSQGSIWTPEDEALLWYIYKKVKRKGGNFRQEIVPQWAQLRPDRNIRESVLLDKIKKFKDLKYRPDLKEAEKAKELYSEKCRHGAVNSTEKVSRRWTEEKETLLLYVYNQAKHLPGKIATNMEKRWAQIYGPPSPVSGVTLHRRARALIQNKYQPKSKYLEKAKAKYDSLPPLEESDFKGKSILNEPDPEEGLGNHMVFSVPGHIATPRDYAGCGIKISSEPSHGRQFGSLMTSTGQSSRQYYQNVSDYIATPRFQKGHEIQQQNIFDTGYHTAYPYKPPALSVSSSSDNSIDKYLNLSYQDSDHST